MENKIDICYLCCKKLKGNIDDDHVPPKQFYAKSIRKMNNPNLFTLPTHTSCNKSYQMDEDYFVQSLAPLAIGSYSGTSIWEDISQRMKRPESQKINMIILKEFDQRIILPNNKIIKRFDGKRARRIIWKITRGLFFKETGRFLPENTPRLFKFISVDEKPPREFFYISSTPSRGQYPGVFDYKYIDLPKYNNFHCWGMLFWDKLIVTVAFHDPSCSCNKYKNP
ncbi:MAG: hypothetical protein PHW73_03435 [Atribacterota bacterium]|nr:hypothetical protein [Atribacterota bacterium]